MLKLPHNTLRRRNGTFQKGSTGWRRDRQSVLKRFWSKVRKTKTCWLYVGQRNGEGYGEFSAFGIKGKVISAHRFMWTVVLKRRTRKYVLHTCDIGHCVRPVHLYAGTQKQNVADALKRKRRPQNTSILIRRRNAQAA